MKIGGLQKTSLLDYPDKLSAIIWTVGCNLRCPYCYNPNLVYNKNLEYKQEEDVIIFLKNRKKKLEAISITGGEPLLQENIFEFIKKIKNIGYLIKIDTNGTFPNKLKKLIDENLVDYIAMDIKASKEKYDLLCGRKVNIRNIQKSIDIIKRSSIKYEFRTTIIPNLLDKNDIIKIAKWLKGANQFFLQQFKNESSLILKKLEEEKPYTKEYLNNVLAEIKPFFNKCNLRGE